MISLVYSHHFSAPSSSYKTKTALRFCISMATEVSIVQRPKFPDSCRSQNQSYIVTYSQSESLSWCQAPIWDPRPIFRLLSLIIFRQLRVCWCGAPSLTRSRICSFQFLQDIASAAFLKSESHEHVLLYLFLRLPQPREPGSCIYFPQEQGSPVIPSGIGFDSRNSAKMCFCLHIVAPIAKQQLWKQTIVRQPLLW
jgi:hypothetical protein